MPAPLGGEQIRGHRKLDLIRLLAVGGKTQDELADMFGVTQPAISMFKKRYAREIEHVKENLEDQFAGLWIARKEARVAELEDIAEKFAEAPGRDSKAAQIRLRALRQASEELGQLRIQIDTNAQVEYSVEGVDPEELK